METNKDTEVILSKDADDDMVASVGNVNLNNKDTGHQGKLQKQKHTNNDDDDDDDEANGSVTDEEILANEDHKSSRKAQMTVAKTPELEEVDIDAANQNVKVSKVSPEGEAVAVDDRVGLTAEVDNNRKKKESCIDWLRRYFTCRCLR
ncbi:uncharacterized protein LOC127866846 [Dreissena polymorpha]|uniref:uncharacterized protein LOC127866845 n=1 Tax=Dreissena polymorpha TaxID=45954 RepID=UPI0022645D4C|nr:uncharacterized protein LOC127866845 [Dreissena polymorpha]XP_052263639.1 uncharacterized protein LOC127866846 [Dreissena polymorpha]